jgi:hypothetical protein
MGVHLVESRSKNATRSKTGEDARSFLLSCCCTPASSLPLASPLTEFVSEAHSTTPTSADPPPRRCTQYHGQNTAHSSRTWFECSRGAPAASGVFAADRLFPCEIVATIQSAPRESLYYARYLVNRTNAILNRRQAGGGRSSPPLCIAGEGSACASPPNTNHGTEYR